MKQKTLLEIAKLLKTEDLELKEKAHYRLVHSMDNLPNEVVLELISLLENKDCRVCATDILLGYGFNHAFSSKAQVMLVRLLANKECQVAVEKIFSRYCGLKYTRNLSVEAEVELVSLLLKDDCPKVIKDFFWEYVETYTIDTWYVPYYRSLSDMALSKLIDCLEDKMYKDEVKAILLRYLNHSRGYRRNPSLSHGLLPKHQVRLVNLLKKQDYQNAAKEILLKYADSFLLSLSKAAEIKLIYLLWNKSCRNLAKEILMKHAENYGLSKKGEARFDTFLKFVRLFKTQTCKVDLSSFYTRLQLA